MKKQGVAQLKKKADAIFSKYIRFRDGQIRNGVWQSQCITCGVWRPLTEMQNGHFVKRSVNKLRYDEENCNAQCSGCNVFRYGEQYLYAKALDLKYGDGTADKLMAQRFDTHKLTITELESIINDCKEQLKEMGNENDIRS